MSYDQLCTARAQFSDIFSDVCPIFYDISDIVGDFEMIFGFFGDFMRDFQFLDVFRTETTTFQNCARVAQNCARVAQNCARVALSNLCPQCEFRFRKWKVDELFVWMCPTHIKTLRISEFLWIVNRTLRISNRNLWIWDRPNSIANRARIITYEHPPW